MKSDLRENMYIRTNYGRIDKIFNIKDDYVIGVSPIDNFYVYYIDSIVKASYNIIDILEKGDYVNGDKIEYIDDCKGAMREFYYDYENPNDDVGHWQEEIKTIITHEQMEQMAYKVVE